MYSYYFTICTLFFNFLLMFAYFAKKKVKRVENGFYSGVVICSFLGLIFEIVSAYLILSVKIPTDGFWYNIFVKIMYLIYLFWVTFISMYFVSLLYKNKNKKIFNVRFMFIIMTIFNILLLFTPLDAVIINDTAVPVGSFIFLSNFLGIIYIAILIIMITIHRKDVEPREIVPLICALLIIFLDIFLKQYMQLFLTHCLTTYVAFIMYFTIQNPDIKMLEQVEIAKNHADKANKAKSEFLSLMSHEIRTPLNAIVGFSEWLKEEQMAASAKEAVDDIISASQILLETVNGILDISKIEANKIEIINSDYNFDDLFNNLVTLSKARLGTDKPIEFRYHKSDDIPKYLYGDCTRIKQIAINLLTNAIKYTKKGYILFDVSCTKSEDEYKLIIKVKDTGMGIKKENISKLFNKFERLDNENSGIEGTGLGLAITKKLVEMMNGDIYVESEYGVGSTFTVILNQKIATQPIEMACKNMSEVTINRDLSNKKVLVVDDNDLNLKVSRNLLKAYNIVPVEIKSGNECLNLIRQGNIYDLILLDDMMPEKSGKETLKELKEIEGFNIPVVMLTANAIEGMKEEYLSLGFDDYLAKPIDREQLKIILKKYLDK